MRDPHMSLKLKTDPFLLTMLGKSYDYSQPETGVRQCQIFAKISV